jgi:hypothetical protein
MHNQIINLEKLIKPYVPSEESIRVAVDAAAERAGDSLVQAFFNDYKEDASLFMKAA